MTTLDELPPYDRDKDLPIFTVYNSPLDFQGMYVLRLWIYDKPTPWVRTASTLEAIRALVPLGFVRLPRHPGDDYCIVETWI